SEWQFLLGKLFGPCERLLLGCGSFFSYRFWVPRGSSARRLRPYQTLTTLHPRAIVVSRLSIGVGWFKRLAGNELRLGQVVEELVSIPTSNSIERNVQGGRDKSSSREQVVTSNLCPLIGKSVGDGLVSS